MSGLVEAVQFWVWKFAQKVIQIISDVFLSITSLDLGDFWEIVTGNFAGLKELFKGFFVDVGDVVLNER